MIGWIRAHDATEISREDVRREALRQTVNAAGADEVILALEEAGVLREVDDEEDYRGRGRPARRWQVNPALLAKPAAQIAEKPEEGPDPPFRLERPLVSHTTTLGSGERSGTRRIWRGEGEVGRSLVDRARSGQNDQRDCWRGAPTPVDASSHAAKLDRERPARLMTSLREPERSPLRNDA